MFGFNDPFLNYFIVHAERKRERETNIIHWWIYSMLALQIGKVHSNFESEEVFVAQTVITTSWCKACSRIREDIRIKKFTINTIPRSDWFNLLESTYADSRYQSCYGKDVLMKHYLKIEGDYIVFVYTKEDDTFAVIMLAVFSFVDAMVAGYNKWDMLVWQCMTAIYWLGDGWPLFDVYLKGRLMQDLLSLEYKAWFRSWSLNEYFIGWMILVFFVECLCELNVEKMHVDSGEDKLINV